MEHGEIDDFSTLRYITDKESSQDLNQKKEPCIIISASGMAEAGRVNTILQILFKIQIPFY